jgi:RND family efflux transporter MFP subunit
MQKPLFMTKLIVASLLAAGLITGVLIAASGKVQAADSKDGASGAKPALTVTAIKPSMNQVAAKISVNGNVAAWQEASVGSESAGLRIENLYVNVGDVVKKGQVLASFASEAIKADVAQANAALLEATAFAQDAINNADRARGLQSSGAISKQQIGQYLTAEQTAKARVNAAKAVLDVQKLRLKYTQVVAPDAGVISSRTTTVGAVVGNGVELFKLIRQGRLEWRAEVISADLSKINSGMAVTMFAPNGAQAQGKVRVVAPTVDAHTRTGLVYVDIQADKNTKESFKPGMFARGEFAISQSQALTIPQQAVVVRDGFTYVFKLNADLRVTQIKIQAGRRMATTAGEFVEVVSGLNPDTQVVSSGAGFLSDGDLVKLVSSPTPNKTPAPVVKAK